VAAVGNAKKTRGRPRATAHGEKSGNTVQAVDRAFQLLRNIAETQDGTLTEISMNAGMAPSTTHRLLMTMQNHGLVAFDESNQHWQIGVEAFRIGSAFLRRTKVVDAGRPSMRTLMEKTGETSNLAIMDDSQVVFISQIETPAAIRASFPSGTRAAMHSSGIGKALLAELSREKVQAILQKSGLPSFTPNTITSATALFADLKEIRQRGWSIDNEERTAGMRCIAAAIFNEYGEPVAGISISGPSARLTDEKLGEFAPLVKRMADKVTLAIGGVIAKHGSS